MDMDVITILKFEEMAALYIKILKKTITDTELELFKYNLEISCCVPNAIFFNLNYICLFNYLFISSQMSAKPYFIGSTGILLLW